MEASALHAPATVNRLTLSGPLLRLRSDEQLVALFRAGSEDAFTVIHDRYKQRLFAYVRQMLSSASRQDAEDVLQDVFVRAYGALRADTRDINLRAWLYRVAHNRCIDHFRRPTPPAADIFETSRSPLHDPMEIADRREHLKRLVADVSRLPDQQRSALLMREIDGLAYADIADALDVTVPAVKSLLVRARVGLVEAAEARDTDCAVIRDDLMASYDRGVKASGRARRHMRECSGCREYRTSLKGMRRSFAALSPVGVAGPVALVAKALGIGGASAGGGAAVGGGATVAGTGIATATACKVAAVVCATAITAGGAVEVKRIATDDKPQRAKAATKAAAAPAVAAAAAAAASVPVTVAPPVLRHRTERSAPPAAIEQPAADAPKDPAAAAGDAAAPLPNVDQVTAETAGGALAPVTGTVPTTDTPAKPADDGQTSGSGSSTTDGGTAQPETAPSGSGSAPAEQSGSTSGSSSGSEAPPSEH